MTKKTACLFASFLFITSGTAHAANSADILKDARHASAGDAWARVRNLLVVGTSVSSGMRSDYREADSIASPLYARTEDAGVVRYRTVWHGAEGWRQDPSGGVHRLDSAFARQAGITQQWLAGRGYLKPDAGGAALGPAERRSDAGTAFDVVAATPRGGQRVELWFDAGTHLLARSVRVMPIHTETARYSDYRAVQGLQLAHRIDEDDGDPDSVETVRVASVTPNGAAAADFASPVQPANGTVQGGTTTVPVEIDGDVIVEATIDGKGPFAFILDTGGHDILTPDAAKALGLIPEGHGVSGGAGAGTLAEQYARAHVMRIGGAALQDPAFTILPLQYNTVERGPRPALAGILGLEIFEYFAVRIDYRGQRLSLTPLDAYRHSGAGAAVPISFSDDMPLLTAKLEGHAGDFGVDTGNSGSVVVQGHWADREGLAGKLKSGLETVSFGAGGASRNWASRVDLDIAGRRLHHMVARYASDSKGAFSSITEAANIGTDVLANFTLDFDYRRGQMWLNPVPGWTPPDFNRSGLGVFKEKAETFRVASVPRDTPAAQAGLKDGDEIAAVDGVPAARMTGWDFRRAMRRAPGTKVRLDVLRGGKHQAVTLTLREMLP